MMRCYATDGSPYGKLRVDVTVLLDFEGDLGSTYFMYCEKK